MLAVWVTTYLIWPLTVRRTTYNALQPTTTNPALPIHFVGKREQCPQKIPPRTRFIQLEAVQDWQIVVDMCQRLTVPSDIAITNLRPDLVLWSNSHQCMVYIMELSPLGGSCAGAYEIK